MRDRGRRDSSAETGRGRLTRRATVTGLSLLVGEREDVFRHLSVGSQQPSDLTSLFSKRRPVAWTPSKVVDRLNLTEEPTSDELVTDGMLILHAKPGSIS